MVNLFEKLCFFCVIIDKNDDFPAPDGPIMVKKSPERTYPLRLFNIIFLSCEFISEIFFHFKVKDSY
jgi:hypothetical protein